MEDPRYPRRQPWRGRLIKLTYMVAVRGDRDLRASQGRDGGAAFALEGPLRDLGYDYGGEVLFYPGKELRPHVDREIDESYFDANDLLLLTTRPPLSDHHDGARKHIPRSFTRIERLVLDYLTHHLPHCSRVKMSVSGQHVRASADIARFGSTSFKQNRWADIDDKNAPARGPNTLAYMIYTPHAWEGGPALFASFGLTGETTLAWNVMLARDYPHLICSVPFALVEMWSPTRPDRPQTLDFIDDWSVAIHTSDAPVSFTRREVALA